MMMLNAPGWWVSWMMEVGKLHAANIEMVVCSNLVRNLNVADNDFQLAEK